MPYHLLAVLLVLQFLPTSAYAFDKYNAVPSHRYLSEYQQMNDPAIKSSLMAVISQIDPDLKITGRECGQINAFYSPANKEIVLCYEYLHNADKTIDKLYPNHPIQTRALLNTGVIAGVLFHELGHAIIHLKDVPVLGNQEDAADNIATIFLIEMTKRNPGLGKHLIVGKLAHDWHGRFSALSKLLIANDLYADEHALNEQRVFNMICLAYGSNPALFQDVAISLKLPQNRAKRCAYEYQSTSKAVFQMIK
ncbi:DUF4344 domain-containing metallopeptidase [Pararhizobium sp.]|uniref:DUF4344 domain-containing metallopeptidase n=1 Tax=Pararhizobium sp. TaxID=1977563 RepID=UPI0027286EF8|nr:DUF4344 domain-containing metallopeptidase [Pararhizobium sp.]MDO9416055.1 DUF4344 domain-containing metallopeptidase [Pararhizobium sp.]MDP2247260.1 DUF4344 domain-containing metallopeptidase [Nitrosomonadales bacterium]